MHSQQLRIRLSPLAHGSTQPHCGIVLMVQPMLFVFEEKLADCLYLWVPYV